MHYFCLSSPQNTNKEKHFHEISVNINKAFGKYVNIIHAGVLNIDIDIDVLRPCSYSSKNYLSDMKDVFSLKNLIKEPTTFKS